MNGIPIKYVGLKPSEVDTVANTGLMWLPGEVHLVTPRAANRMLRHPDVWVIADDGDAKPTSKKIHDSHLPDDEPEQEDEDDDVLPNFVALSKDDIAVYAKRSFGVSVPGDLNKPALIKLCVDLKNARSASGKIERVGRVVAVDPEIEARAKVVERPGAAPEIPGVTVRGYASDEERQAAERAEREAAEKAAAEAPSDSGDNATPTEDAAPAEDTPAAQPAE